MKYKNSIESNVNTHQRVVTVPKEIAQPVRWADRQANKRNTNVEQQTRTRSVKRTLAKTGVPATEGQVRILTMFALFVIVGVGVSFALSSTNFQIHQIDIMGTQNATLVDDIQHMGIQGQNIFLLDAGDLSARIEALPMVDSVTLSKQLPNLVIINVVERTPVLLWQTQQGTFSVDHKGVVIAPDSDTAGIYHLMNVVDVSKRLGQHQIHPGTLFNADDIAFVTQLNRGLQHLLGMSTFTLRYDVLPGQGGHGSFIVASTNGWIAYLGNADDSNPLHNRLIELQQILHLAQQQQLKLATIDLRFGLRPVYTLKS